MHVVDPSVTEVRRPISWTGYLAYGMFGSGSLVAWNAVFSVSDYWESRWPHDHPSRLFTIVYMPLNLLGVACFTRWHSLIPTHLRIIYGFLAMTAIIVALPLLGIAEGTKTTLAITLALLGLAGISDAASEGAMFAETAVRPAQYTRALVLGQAGIGIGLNVLSMVTKAALPSGTEGLKTGADIFLALTACWILACSILYIIMRRRGLIYEQRGTVTALPTAMVVELKQMETSESADGDSDKPTMDADASKEGSDKSTIGTAPPGAVHGPLTGLQAMMEVGRLTWPLCLGLFLIFAVTLSIFPGVLVEDSRSNRMNGWYSLLLVSMYNLGDLLGRIASMTVEWLRWTDMKAILFFCVLRLLYIPAIYFGVRVVAVMIVLTITLGFTNGLLTSSAMAAGPLHVPAHLAEMAGNVMVLSLTVGLLSGAGFGFLWLLAD